MSFVAWGILASGLLSGKYNQGAATGGRLEVVGLAGTPDERTAAIVHTAVAIAEELGVTPSQVAVRWVLDQPNVIPLIGARTLAQCQDNLAALTIELSAGQRARLDEVATIDLGFPHDFVERGRAHLFGPSWSRVDSPSGLRS
jgi:aryl-alcohol dehydrogenase-like predicted oxidoreductase